MNIWASILATAIRLKQVAADKGTDVSVVVLEKGPNRLLELEPPYALKGDLSNDEIKLWFRWFLGPDPLLEPRTYRRTEADGDHVLVGEVNNLPSGVGGGAIHADAKMTGGGKMSLLMTQTSP